MYVIKRDKTRQLVHFDKILSRIQNLCDGLDANYVDPAFIAQKVIQGVHPGVTTTELDNLAAEAAAYSSSMHHDYSILASRIAVSNLQKQTAPLFTDVIDSLYHYIEPKSGEPAPMIAQDVYEIICANKDRLNQAIVHTRDFDYDYFGFKTLEKSYLLKINGEIVERPQYMLMRVSVGIHKNDIDAAIHTYNLMSQKYFTHATPTLFNAGTPHPQMSSCFLIATKSDSIEGIYDTLKECALISKSAGGIGLHVSNIRAAGSYIKGTNGTSNGLVPMLRVFDTTARYVDQGGGKRKGAIAIYIEPWHADILDVIELKKNHGKEERRARDLFYALWIPDLFMERVKANKPWSLMCPNQCPGLQDCYGQEFKTLYESYEAQGKFKSQIPAQKLLDLIIVSQTETGGPYMLYKDACNAKSNQKNLGVIKNSNLCTEIVQYTSPQETAVCNLASVNLARFVDTTDKGNPYFDFETFGAVVETVTRNLNKVIDENYYPCETARNSNLKHRPIGMGIQGLADAFVLLRLPFESEGAKRANKEIFECMYYHACKASNELAKKDGPYSSFKGSPMSMGQFQFDMWGVSSLHLSGKWDWEPLRKSIMEHGIRNSLLIAPMPTASTAQILGNNEAFEPFTTNLYLRRVLAGEFYVLNKHLVKDLIRLGLWDDTMRNELKRMDGSIQGVSRIPADIRELYKTVWEIKQKNLIEMAADRGIFIDQSQSMNLFISDPTEEKMRGVHMMTWSLGLKTGLYYLRTKAKANAIKFTVEASPARSTRSVKSNRSNGSASNPDIEDDESSSRNLGEDDEYDGPACTMKEGCLSCGS